MSKEIILIADRLLVEPDDCNNKTDGGLYLPAGVKEKEKVLYGKIVKSGPGYPVIDPSSFEKEPWIEEGKDKYFPLQAKVGDNCLFLKDVSYEIQYEKIRYFVVPHSAILLLIRDESKIAGVVTL